MRSAIEGIVRWTTPSIYKRRTVTRDVEFHGAFLKTGDKLTIWEMSANRDDLDFPITLLPSISLACRTDISGSAPARISVVAPRWLDWN